MLTFQSPFVAVAVCTSGSLLIHSIVSPALAFTFAGVKTSLSILTCSVPARAQRERPNIVTATRAIRSGVMAEFLPTSRRPRHVRHAAGGLGISSGQSATDL